MPNESLLSHNDSILTRNGYGLYTNPFRNFGPYRIRFRFDDLNHDPTRAYPGGATKWTRVSYSPNIWDYYYPSSDWEARFQSGYGDSGAIINAPCSVLIANLEGVTNIRLLFANGPYGDQPIYVHDVYNFYAPDVTNATHAFSANLELETCDIISLGAPSYADSIFAGCPSLKKAPYFCTSNMTSGSGMFSGCRSLVDVPLYDMSNMTDIKFCFSGCRSLVHVPEFQTGSVRDFSHLFDVCTSLQESHNFNTANGESLAYMYAGCTSLRIAPALTTGNVRFFQHMFSGCTALTYVPLYDTSAMTSDIDGECNNMFSECRNVSGGALDLYNQISATGWQPASSQYYMDAFKNCGILTESGYRDLEQIPTTWGGLKEN